MCVWCWLRLSQGLRAITSRKLERKIDLVILCTAPNNKLILESKNKLVWNYLDKFNGYVFHASFNIHFIWLIMVPVITLTRNTFQMLKRKTL